MISALIPWRESSPARGEVFEWVLERMRRLVPDLQVCLGDSGHAEFNRGASINRAFERAEAEMLLIADADTVFNAAMINEAIKLAADGSTWVLPYTDYFNLDQPTTDRLLSGPPDVTIDQGQIGYEFWLTDSVSGLIVLTPDAFEAVGGFDEEFRSWGYEDRAFEAAANTLIGECTRLDGACFHLAHPVGERFDQPEIEFNRQLAKYYVDRLGDREAMRYLVGRGPQ